MVSLIWHHSSQSIKAHKCLEEWTDLIVAEILTLLKFFMDAIYASYCKAIGLTEVWGTDGVSHVQDGS